jgi:hypothetical protein
MSQTLHEITVVIVCPMYNSIGFEICLAFLQDLVAEDFRHGEIGTIDSSALLCVKEYYP